MNYYAVKRGEFGKTWAILSPENEVTLCDWRTARKWLKNGGEKRCKIRESRVGRQEIETRFEISSANLDGPHLFWEVRVSERVIPRRSPSSLWHREINAVSKRIKTPEEALKAKPPIECFFRFLTLQEALGFHKTMRKHLVQLLKGSQTKTDLTEELLLRLTRWCEEKWGRQALAARCANTSPQTINDWLAGRKRMTGEQALRIHELLAKEHVP